MLQEGTEDKTGCKSVGVLYQNLYNRNSSGAVKT